MSPVKRKPFNIAGVKPEVVKQLEALPCFSGVSTARLCQNAMSQMRYTHEITCRITAMIVIVNNRPLTDDVFHLPPTAKEMSL